MLLGTGTYDCFTQEQGGGVLTDVLKWGSLTFGRRLNDISTASTSCLRGSSPGLGVVDAWSHELLVLRDGEQVWVGPLQTPTWEDTVTLPASDVFVWFERRLLDRRDHKWHEEDLGSMFATIVSDALEKDNTPGISLATSLTGIHGDRTVEAAQRGRAADVLRELSRSAVDWTAIGRQVLAGGEEIPGAPTFTLTDDAIDSPKLTSEGTDAATRAVVVGANTGVKGVPVVGDVGGIEFPYGLVEQAYAESTIEDIGSARAAASSRWAFLHEPPKYLTGRLRPEAPIDFAQLIPGARVNAKIYQLDRPVDAPYRLTDVDVSVSASDQGIQEEINVTLAPLGLTSIGA